MLYVGSEAPLSEEAVAAVQALAEAFAVAYARYEDFQRLEAKNREIEEAMAELRTMQAQLVHTEKLASLGQLTAGIAHEIKNPLNFVNNFAILSGELVDELQEGTNPVEWRATLDSLRENVAKIEEHGRRADSIVRAMMEHARSGSGERRVADLNDLVEEYADLAYHAMQARHPGLHVAFTLDLADDAGTVEVVSQEIGRVVVNLLDNAFDAVRERASGDDASGAGFSPSVTVATRRLEGEVEVRVADNGPGMSPEVAAKVFEPFFTTKPSGQGTGLGLSMSHDIVAQGHGGELDHRKPGGRRRRVRATAAHGLAGTPEVGLLNPRACTGFPHPAAVGLARGGAYTVRLPRAPTCVIVAIDGPAGSGKSTTARRVAQRLGGLYLDTGAMYRAIGLAFLDQDRPFTDGAAADLVPALRVELDPHPDTSELSVRLNGDDVTERIRSGPAAQAASRAAALAPVREAMLVAQRAVAADWNAHGRAVVAEGRDVGSVVFPDAPVKFFLTADIEARAQRRAADLAASGETADVDRVRDEIAQRDRRDADRALAPLRPAEDAVVLDTTALSVEEQVERVVQAVRAAQSRSRTRGSLWRPGAHRRLVVTPHVSPDPTGPREAAPRADSLNSTPRGWRLPLRLRHNPGEQARRPHPYGRRQDHPRRGRPRGHHDDHARDRRAR